MNNPKIVQIDELIAANLLDHLKVIGAGKRILIMALAEYNTRV